MTPCARKTITSLLLVCFLCAFDILDEPISLRNSYAGYKYDAVADVLISPKEAIKLAEPYLEKSFELRKGRKVDENPVHKNTIQAN